MTDKKVANQAQSPPLAPSSIVDKITRVFNPSREILITAVGHRMRLTTKGRYAVTAMLDLAIHCDKGPVSLADISERQGISISYLEQLFAKLRKDELVTSVRGPGGGYRLARPANAVFVASIIDAVDEQVDATRCGGQGMCQDGEMCLTHYLWLDLSGQIHAFLSGISLGDLVARQEIRAISARQRERQKHDIVTVRG